MTESGLADDQSDQQDFVEPFQFQSLAIYPLKPIYHFYLLSF